MRRWIGLFVVVLVIAGSTWAYSSLTARSRPVDQAALCYIGAYALPDDSRAVFVAYDNGETLEFFFDDGAHGVVHRQSPSVFAGDGVRLQRPDCGTSGATIGRQDTGTEQAVQKLAFVAHTVHFKNGDIELAGKLTLPKDPARQVVIWVAGSNDDGEIDRTHWQFTLPLHGIASFMLDKRGTGGSGGTVSANFLIRAGDVRAAVAEARRLMGPSMEIGLHGASQGGWVAPLASLGGGVAFVIVSYGLAEGVTAEDRDEMAAYVKQAGYGPEDLAKLRTLTDITSKIVRSHWQDGWDELANWRARHGSEQWLEALPDTSYTGFLIKIPSFASASVGSIIGPLLDKGVSFDYDPYPTLSTLKVPQLWLLGGRDVSAPSTATIKVLQDLKAHGAPIDVVVFQNAGHGLMEPWPGHKTERLSPGYRETVAAWAKIRTPPRSTPPE